MASDNPAVNAQTVEQTKQQIRSLVGEIAQLSKSDVNAEEYYSAFMQRIVSALAAVGGAVWLMGEGKRPELAYQINLSQPLMTPGEESRRHMQLLYQIAQTGEPSLVPPMSGGEGDDAGANPTGFLLVLAPLASDGVTEGVIEVLQRPDTQPATQRGYLRFLIQMCELAGEWLKSRKLKHFSNRHSLWAQADQFARMVHENLDVRETAYVVANEGRRLIGCDRVSVAIKRGRTCKVEAISGQDTIESRSNVVTALNHVATRVVATGETLWYEGASEHLPPQVEEALDAYVDESYAKNVIVLPLRKPGLSNAALVRSQNADLIGERQVEREILGALIVEQIETDLPREILEPRIDLVYEHSARALSNALDHHSVFLMPVWRAIGKSSLLVRGRNLPRALTIGGLILAAILALFLIRTDFDLKATGSLQPVNRWEVFFDSDGTIKEVLVKGDDVVKQGQPLILLENHELEQKWLEVRGQISETAKRLSAVRDQKNDPREMTKAQAAQVAGEYVQLLERAKNLEAQSAMLEKKRESLVVRAPHDGVVLLPWDAQQSLIRRPVMTGQRVLTIADTSGPWELELAMPERRMGHVNKEVLKQESVNLPVSYISAGDPRSPKSGTIREIYGITQVRSEEGPTVKMLVDIDTKELSDRTSPGTTVTAKVKCGRCSVAYAWFHEALEWIQKHVLF